MRPAYFATLACCLAMNGVLAHSQDVPVPLDKLQGDMRIQVLVAADSPADALVNGASISALRERGLIAMHPMAPVQRRVIDGRFLLLNGAHLGMAMFDVEMSQHCIAERKCVEGNPLMPSSQAGQIGVDLGTVTLAAFGAYWARKHRVRTWWMAPTIGIAAHTVGVASGFANR